jgi:hypothetical protein
MGCVVSSFLVSVVSVPSVVPTYPQVAHEDSIRTGGSPSIGVHSERGTDELVPLPRIPPFLETRRNRRRIAISKHRESLT